LRKDDFCLLRERQKPTKKKVFFWRPKVPETSSWAREGGK